MHGVSVQRGGRWWRRGMATGEALVVAISVLAVGGLGVAVVPRAIQGATGAGESPVVVEPRSAAAREALARVRMLIGSSEAVVGCWARRPGGGFELCLWQRDVRDPGVVNADEVVLLSFSPVLGSLSAYVEGRGSAAPEGVVVEGEAVRGAALSGAEVARADFASWWRERPGTGRHVIAAGLSDVRVAPLGAGEAGGRLRVELVWEVASSDGGVEKGAFEVALRRLDAAGANAP